LQLLEDSERKIKIDSDLVHKIIPNDFFNIDLEGREEISSSNENFRNQSKFSQENSLDEPKNRKVNQGQLSLIKFNSLLVLGQVRKHFSKEEYQGYEKRINSASTQEEIEIVEKDFLSKINLSEKNPFIKKRESEKAEDRIKKLEEKIRKMQREITEKERVIFVTIIFALII
jgi:hypothetical protein